MKAITCPQCGATIDDVSEHSLIIHCAYCGARVLLNSAPLPLNPLPVRQSLADTPDFEIDSPPVSPVKIVTFVIAGLAVLPALIGIAIVVFTPKASTPARTYSLAPTPFGYPTPSSWSVTPTVPEKPIPVVNYQPRISWDGPNDLEHFDDPEVDISSVSHLTTEEVKKTVFKNRTVKLRVVINTEGEIDSVETISGHPLLVDAATKSAKRTIFRSRAKPTTRVVTYTFRVLED